MNPVPCAHCGYNYMRHNNEPEALRLCNSCDVREQKRNPPGEKKMDTIDILVKCPKNVYTEIEEICINSGTNPSDYLINLHYAECTKFAAREEHEEKGGKWKDEPKEMEENELPATSTTGTPDKFFKAKSKGGKK